MILINLLPHREIARQRARQQFNLSLILAVVVGVAIGFFIYLGIEGAVSVQENRNRFLQGEVKKLDDEIKEVASLEQEIAALKARQTAVENLQADRNMPVHLMNEAVSQLPEGMYLKSIKQENQSVLISGVAQSNERVSQLLRNLSNKSEWITKPELIEIVAADVTLGPKNQRRAFNFTVRAQLQRASDAASAAQPAANVKPGAAAASASKGKGA
jgi:type IV pilus assembly protein PilN